MRVRLVSALLLALVLAGQVLSAEPVAELAGFINQTAGLNAGMALIVDDADGQLTAAIAKGNRLTVQGCTRDDKAVQPGRAMLLAAGVADRGTLILIETNGLPYADSLINLLVAAPWGRQPIDFAELLRVLAPGGIALIGNDASPAAMAGLEAKLRQAGACEIQSLSRKGWFKFSKPVNPDFDVWTHNLGGPDLSSVNHDKVAGPWSELRWVGDPRWGALGITYSGRVTAGGRFYYLENRTGPTGGALTWLVARDAWNGFEFWRLPIGSPPKYGTVGRTLTCDEKWVYCVEENKSLIARDGRSGLKVREYAPGFLPTVATSVGSVLLVCDMHISPAVATRVVAMEKETGKEVWRRPGIVHPPVEKGTAFVLSVSGLEGVDVETGTSRWKALAVVTNGTPNLFCKAGVVYATYTPPWKPMTLLAAYDAGTGGLLWKQENPGGGACLPLPDGLWRTGLKDKGDNVLVLDVRTGDRKRELLAKGFGKCFPITGCANYLLYCNSTYLSVDSGIERTLGAVRSPCFLGHVPANGLTYFLPHHCDCGVTLRGLLAMAPAGSRTWLSGAATNGIPQAVSIGPAPAAPPAESGGDWPMYRKDTTRSNFMAEKLPEQLKLRWSEKLGGSRLSQAVSAYGVVCTTEPQMHRVMARDAATGKDRWSFIADGRTDYPPALSRGLCIFSTGAGSVYALDAVTGKEVWRMRASPAEKYITEEGQFASAWPVIGGVMPMNSEIFFTCGRSVSVDGGLWLFAADATTGKVRWRVKGGVSGGDMFLSDGKELYLTKTYWRISDGGRVGGGKAPSGILRTTAYLTYVALADYMACVEPALSHQKHVDLTDGRITGENLAFSDKLGVAAWRYRFGVPATMMKKEKTDQRFIYAKAEGTNIWLLDDRAPQMLGLILAGETAYMAGVPTAENASQKPELWVLAGADGRKLQVLPLEARPVYDGLSAAGGRLYLATEEGQLFCYDAM
jgi:outer membrane protein assembly factor BamB